MTIEVKDLDHSRRPIATIDRKPVDRVGWQKVRYQNRWFQLHGGVRTDYFINVSNPIATLLTLQ